SDCYALPDYPHANEAARQAWLDYRQALRNVPELDGFPWDGANDPAVPWPVEPVGEQG
ncbi:phage tail assembly chaperone, partial [Desulfocurvibacter africanus]|uniref:phage tail assembly chaperone n=1 Tax=Desulfocurvibacter africanus TaxID=873 RepID=UPI002FD97762